MRHERSSEIEVFIVEDHLALRSGLALLLKAAGMRIAGTASELGEASAMLYRRRFDVALIDLDILGGSGLELVSEILVRDPGSAVVIYTGLTERDQLRRASRLGARGFVLKASPSGELISALRLVAGGGRYTDRGIARLLSHDPPPSPLAKLTPREREILGLLGQGLTGELIARRLSLSRTTVRTHIGNATRKLGAGTRAQAVAIFTRAS
jgi:two-component system response regulator DevR